MDRQLGIVHLYSFYAPLHLSPSGEGERVKIREATKKERLGQTKCNKVEQMMMLKTNAKQ